MKKYLVPLLLATVVNPNLIAQTLLDDQFANGNRTVQSLPSSAAWYSRGATSTATASTAGINFDFTADDTNGVLSYFTNSGAQSLLVGETITISFDLTFTGGSLSTGNHRVRFGLLNSGGSRISADNTNFNDSAFSGYRGYLGYVGLRGSGESVLVKRDKDNNNLVTGTATTELGSEVDTPNFSLSVTYNLSVSVERTSVSANTITWNVDNSIGSFSRNDTSGIYTDFDTALISFHETGADSALIDNVSVQVIPEPGTVALLGAGSLLLLAFRRRRH